MTDSTVTFNEEFQDLNGTGAYLNIDFNTEAEEELSSGTYTYIEKQEVRDAFTFSGAEFLVVFFIVVTVESTFNARLFPLGLK